MTAKGFTTYRTVHGFTLLELLITVAIIAMLSAVALSSFTYLQKNSRDTRRMSDLKVIQSALEQYRADQSVYPLAGTTTAGTIDMGGNNSFTDPDGNKKYLRKIPLDPTGASYYYLPLPSSPQCDNISISSRCTGYCLMTNLENGNEIISGCNSSPPFYDMYNYAVSVP